MSERQPYIPLPKPIPIVHMEDIKGLVLRKARALKKLFDVPPISESMALVIILFVFTNSVATSIWMSNAWTPFVFTLFHESNLYVGLMSAAHGIFDLVFAMITGHFVDTRFGPSQTLIFAVRFGFLNLIIVMIGMWSEKLSVLILSQCCEGIYMGLSFTCMESVFAQCLKRGERDRLYSLKFSCEAAGPIVGIFLTLILYGVLGDHWEVPILRGIMTFGVGLHMLSIISFLYYFKPLPWVKKGGKAGGGSWSHGDEMKAEKKKVVTIVAVADEANSVEEGANQCGEGVENERGRNENVKETDDAAIILAHDGSKVNRKAWSASHLSSSLPNSSFKYTIKDSRSIVVTSNVIAEDHRTALEEEDLLYVEEEKEDSTFEVKFAGPSTEYANRARTAIISSSSPQSRSLLHGKYEVSSCSPAPEVRDEVLSELYNSFSASQHSIEIRSVTRSVHDGAKLDLEGNYMTLGERKLPEARDDAELTDMEMENSWMFSSTHSKGSRGDLHREQGLEVGTKTCTGTKPRTLTSTSELPASTVPYTRFVDPELNKATGWRRWLMTRIPFLRYPIFVALSDFIITVGSGMTTQYFTLFMMKLYNVNPTQMALLNLSNSCIITVLAIVVGAFGRRHGRVRAILPPKICGAMILLWMALARGSTYAPKWLMCVAFVVRGALMNCSSGLARALIMDLVPEHLRGRWNAVESLQSAGWSGTALFGGYLADRWGYGTAFIFTFFFHVVGIAVVFPLAVRNDTKLPVLVVMEEGAIEEDLRKEIREPWTRKDDSTSLNSANEMEG